VNPHPVDLILTSFHKPEYENLAKNWKKDNWHLTNNCVVNDMEIIQKFAAKKTSCYASQMYIYNANSEIKVARFKNLICCEF
jgi:hypothetical protein